MADLGNYIVDQEDATHFILKHKEGGDHEEFKLDMMEEGGKIVFRGMPEPMKKFLLGFDQKEIKDYPTTVLNVIIKQAYHPKPKLKSTEEVKTMISNAAEIKEENPSKYYKVVGKEGVGGFARVFRVEKLSNKKLYALKFIEPKSKNERNSIMNEIGIMQLSSNKSVV